MKQFKLSNEVAKNLLSQLEIMKTDKNKVRLEIGVKNAGKGVACKATIVSGGMMLVTGFVTSAVPKDYEDGSLYLSCAVKASELCSYLSAFLPFNADVSFSFDEKVLTMSVGTQAKVKLALVDMGECEPLLVDDSKESYCATKDLSVPGFLSALNQGGYLVKPEVDPRGITDRVVLSFTNNNITVYSAESAGFATSWCDANVQFIESLHALSHIPDDAKISYMGRLKNQEISQEDFLAYAKENGYEKGVLNISLSSGALNALTKVIRNSAQISVFITSKYMRVMSGNVQTVYALAGSCPTIYKQALGRWDESKFSGHMTVDKESLCNALHIMKLSSADKPFLLTSKSGNLVVTDTVGNSVKTAIVASEGDFEKVSAYFSCDKTLSALNKMPNGNVCVHIDAKLGIPAVLTNGEISGNGVTCKAYVMPVNYKPEAVEEDKADNSAEKQSDETAE